MGRTWPLATEIKRLEEQLDEKTREKAPDVGQTRTVAGFFG